MVVGIPVRIEKEELNGFEDPWEYRVSVHGEPLLGSVEGNHSLPPAPVVSFSFSKGNRMQQYQINKVGCFECKAEEKLAGALTFF